MFYSNVLPLEMVNMIIYKHGGLLSPTANIIKQYWNKMEKECRVFEDLVLEEQRRYVLNEDETEMTLAILQNYIFKDLEYPRVFFNK